LALCEKSFSKRQAFAYLEELQTEFAMQYGQKLGTVSRPYSFIEFGKPVLCCYYRHWLTSATTIPKSLLLGTGLTRSNLEKWVDEVKMECDSVCVTAD